MLLALRPKGRALSWCGGGQGSGWGLEQQIPPSSLRSGVGLTRGIEVASLGCRDDKGVLHRGVFWDVTCDADGGVS